MAISVKDVPSSGGNSNNGETRVKNKVRKKKHRVLFGVLLSCFCVFIALALTAGVVGCSVLVYMNKYIHGDLATDMDYYKANQNQTTIMYAYDEVGKAVETCRLHGEENRIWVNYDQMPDNLIWAYVCLEDKRFFEHSGVDWIRTASVFVKYDFSQGGSTLTQQLIKNLTNQKEGTFVRKFYEILKALNLENYYSKKDIIEAYLNTLYLGEGCYGVKTAAETYFGKQVKDLNLAECALFAGITKSPYTMGPLVNLEKAKARQKTCLDFMLEQGKITKKQYKEALNYKFVFVKKTNNNSQTEGKDKKIQSYYEDYVISQVIEDLQKKYEYDYNEAWRKVYYGGLKIYSAVDSKMQNTVSDIFANRRNFPYAPKHRKDGSLPQCSMVIMDYEGRIMAIAGGAGKKTENRSYNRATDSRAKRQPGSSIKPLTVYGPAVDIGVISADSLILNQALKYNGRTWPRNVDGSYGSGTYVPVKYALQQSINTVAARIVYEMLGVSTSFNYGNDVFHLSLSEKDKDLAPLACGGMTYGVTTLEMAQAYAVFGNGGHYYHGYSYYKVLDKDGTVLLDNGQPAYEQAIKGSTASSMLSMMTNVVTNGTGKGAKVSGFQTFGKTGSTSDYCDRWFCGGTPYYVAAVWYGYDYKQPMSSGTNAARNIFGSVMNNVHRGLAYKDFNDTVSEQEDNKQIAVTD